MLQEKLQLSDEQINTIYNLYYGGSLSFMDSMHEAGLTEESNILEVLAEELGLTLLERKDYPEQPLLLEGASVRFLSKHHCIPVRMDDENVDVVVNDPFDVSLINVLENFFMGRKVHLLLGKREEIKMTVERLYGEAAREAEEAENKEGEASFFVEDLEQLKDLAKEAPVVRRVDYLIGKALDSGASDIHFEPFENGLTVRTRVDGILHTLDELPKTMQAAIISRLKLMANLDIAERRLPQDGGIKWKSGGKSTDIRLSTAPTLYGESVVLRLLSKESASYELDHLGFEDDHLALIKDYITQANGMILVTGPTGSGKTTTLYAVLQEIKDVAKKIITVEDPVEYKIDGINQIQVKPQINLTFASALRSLVRQDPDVLLIGEIRDVETANIAVESALTGHLVLSTLHTKDAPGAVTRLRDLDTESFLIADSVLAILAQRLIRLLCDECKEAYTADPAELEHLRKALPDTPDGVTLYRCSENGCDACGSRGFSGREAIYEVLPMNREIRQAVVAGMDAGQIGDLGKQYGYRTMIQHGYKKVLHGKTTISEILRVTSL
jgi:general secretion pathway protein E